MCLRLCRQPCEDRSVALRFSKVISSLLKQPVAIMCTCTPSNHNCFCLLTHLFYCKRRRARGGVVRAAAWAIFQMIFSLLSSDQWPASQSHIWLIMSWSGSCSHSSEQLWYESISPALGEVKWNPSILKSPPNNISAEDQIWFWTSGFGSLYRSLADLLTESSDVLTLSSNSSDPFSEAAKQPQTIHHPNTMLCSLHDVLLLVSCL